MILIKVYGLDQYVVGNYSKEYTSNLAKLFETKEEEIIFYAPNSYVFYKGVEQTSWNTIIEVVCEEKYHDLQPNITKYIIETFKLFTINLRIIFTYIHSHHVFEHFNKEYPRYIEDKNLVKVDEESLDDVDVTDEEQVYTGDVFKDFKK